MGAERTERHIGDGVWASFDGWQILLRVPRLGGDHQVWLGPTEMTALHLFAQEMYLGVARQRAAEAEAAWSSQWPAAQQAEES
jgi:hypothetical protein